MDSHYQWCLVDEHFLQKETSLKGRPKVIHVFDREGDISEVFEQACQIKNTGVVVRAAHNRNLQGSNQHLWEYVAAQRVQFVLEVSLPETKKRSARIATLEVF